jgi:hypothetical protein
MSPLRQLGTTPLRVRLSGDRHGVDRKNLPVLAAPGLLGLSKRQAQRLLKAHRLRGADGIISKKRSRPRLPYMSLPDYPLNSMGDQSDATRSRSSD